MQGVKYSKNLVGFEHPAQGNDHCLMCRHYQGGVCEIVDGRIRPGDWCNQFSKRRAVVRGNTTQRYHVLRIMVVGLTALLAAGCGGSGSVVSTTSVHWGECVLSPTR